LEMGDLICDWKIPPEKVELHPNSIHLWGVTLKQASPYLEDLRETLTPDERAKAGRILLPRNRDGFVAVRGALRNILSRYHPQHPSDLEFSYGAYGKPELKPSPGAPSLFFNSSHSGEWGLIAVTRAHRVGIDIEFIKPCKDYPAIAENFFSPSEIQLLGALPEELQLHSFLKCWTRKEALSKALGAGFCMDWTSFDVSPSPPERVEITGNGVSKWSVYSFIVAPGYMGALAFEGVNPSLKFWEWRGPAFSGLAPFTAPSIRPALGVEVSR
jgi:4'-phosphopantetheinyl transferase